MMVWAEDSVQLANFDGWLRMRLKFIWKKLWQKQGQDVGW